VGSCFAEDPTDAWYQGRHGQEQRSDRVHGNPGQAAGTPLRVPSDGLAAHERGAQSPVHTFSLCRLLSGLVSPVYSIHGYAVPLLDLGAILV